MNPSRLLSYRPRTLTLQTALLFLISILPMLLISGWLSYTYARNALEETVRIQATDRTEGIQESLGAVILRSWERLENFARSPRLLDGVPPPPDAAAREATRAAYETAPPGSEVRRRYVDVPANSVLMAFTNQYPDQWAVMVTADLRGALTSASTPTWPYWDLARQSWWPDLVHPDPETLGVTRPVDVPGFGPLLLLSVPTHDANFRPSGIVVVGYSMATMAAPILDTGHEPETTAYLVAADGTILYTVPPVPPAHVSAAWMDLLHEAGAGAHTIEANLVSHAPIQARDQFVLDRLEVIGALNRLGWSVLRATPTSRAFASLGTQLAVLAVGSAATALVVVLMALVAVRWLITKPLHNLRGVIVDVRRQGLDAVAGRVAARLPHSRNEIGELSQLFGQLLHELAGLTHQREETASRLREAAARLSSAAEEQVQITTRTNSVLGQVLTAFQALDTAAVAIADHARQVAVQATELRGQHLAGETALTAAQTALANLQAAAGALEAGMRILADDAGAAGTLINEANEVAETTHMLSLNASIEAAGAGVFGARFSVIADEVRLLAAAAAQAATSIERTLARMADQTMSTAAETHQARVAVDSGAAQMEVLRGLMHALLQSAEDLAGNADRIRLRSEDQRMRSQDMHSNSDQLSGAMQQLTTASGHIASQAQELLQLARVLDSPQPSGLEAP